MDSNKPGGTGGPEETGPAPTDHSLLHEIRQGDQAAAALLHQRYAQRLRALARAQCSADLARCVEVDDLVQSVFASFFRAASQGYYDILRGEELWSLFLVIALNKIRARGAYHRAAKRDTRRTVAGAAYEHTLEQVAARDESAQSLLRLTMDDVLHQLPETQQDVIRLRLEGYEVKEIAERLGRSRRTCERLLQEARTNLAELLQEGD
jgi:RNA polymerase sigma-70 factor (ECF subfamily)